MKTQERTNRHTMSRRIRTLILADGASSQQQLATLLDGEPDIELVDHFDEPLGAAEAIMRTHPDLVLFEATREDSTDLEEWGSLDVEFVPALIVIAPSARHALAAFEVRALDYLLMPVQPGRLKRSLQRAVEYLELRDRHRISLPQRHLLEDLESVPHYLTRISVKQDDRVLFLKVDEIVWIEAADNYVVLHAGRQRFTLRERLSALESALDPDQFFRVNRSALINLKFLAELRPMFKGEHVVVLQDGSRLSLTRDLQELEERLKFA